MAGQRLSLIPVDVPNGMGDDGWDGIFQYSFGIIQFLFNDTELHLKLNIEN